MSTEIATFSTKPLSRSDQMELLEYLADSAVEFETANLAPGQLGEPTTAIAIVAVTMVVISGLCAWIASKGRGVSMSVDLKGSGISAGLSLTLSESSTPEIIREELKKLGLEVAEK